jgi:hypothetical protein
VTAVEPELGALDDELDGAVCCECQCDTFPDKHGPARCQRPAAWYVEVHVFGGCRHPRHAKDPGINRRGDRGCVLCRDCLDNALAYVQSRLALLLSPGAVCPTWPQGYGCGKRMATLADYVPVRRPL